MTPKTRNILIGLIAAVATALTAYLQGCTPAQINRANSAAEAVEAGAREGAELARCLRAASEPALTAPNELTLAQALQIRSEIRACFAAAPAPESADAGAQ